MSRDVSDEIAELYQAVILDHNKSPKNFRKITEYTYTHEGFNPICGDSLKVYIKISNDGNIIDDVSFEGEGCAISKASASMMTIALNGKSIDEAKNLFMEFHDLLMKKLDPESTPNSLGKLKLFSGIWKYPARIKCASLPWHTLKAAIEGEEGVTKTE